MFVDTHGHVNFNAYKDDGDEVVKRALDNGVAIIAPASQIDTSWRAIDYAERWKDPRLWAAVGLHPMHLQQNSTDESGVSGQPTVMTRYEEFNRSRYEDLLKSDKVIAVGEIGLDYWRKPKNKGAQEKFKVKQRDTFIAQLDMAADHDLPAIIHCRVAHEDLLEILKNHPITKKVNPPGVIHSYTGDIEQLHKFLDLGYYVGVNGLVYSLDFVQHAIREAPLDRILLETDSPYLTPPQAQTERNEPVFVKYIAEAVAELKKTSLSEVETQTFENAKKVFRVNFE